MFHLFDDYANDDNLTVFSYHESRYLIHYDNRVHKVHGDYAPECKCNQVFNHNAVVFVNAQSNDKSDTNGSEIVFVFRDISCFLYIFTTSLIVVKDFFICFKIFVCLFIDYTEHASEYVL